MINRDNTSPAEAAPEWVVQLGSDPIHAMGLFVHDWHQATEPTTTVPENSGACTQDHLPPALAALDRLVHQFPALRAFDDPLILPPKVLETHPNRLVFASSHSGTRNWALDWPLTGQPDPRVWHLEDPYFPDHTVSTVEAEPLGRFLVQYVLCGTKLQLPCHMTTGLVTVEGSASVLGRLHEVPLGGFSQSVEEGELFYAGPGLIVSVLGNEETGLSLWASSQTPEDLEFLRDDRLTWR